MENIFKRGFIRFLRRWRSLVIWFINYITSLRKRLFKRSQTPFRNGTSTMRPLQPSILKTTPSLFCGRRYEKKSSPNYKRTPALILAGPPSKISIAPKGWVVYYHPEGQPYYYHPNRRIVTESNVLDAHILTEIEQTTSYIESRVQSVQSIKAATELETLVEINTSSDGTLLRSYYLIDHLACTVLWFTDGNSEELNLQPVFSEAHMTTQREEEYWAHLEIFPMHGPYPKDKGEQLLSILSHAVLDGTTCLTSTSVFPPEQCERFIKILNSGREDGYHTCLLARIWRDIILNRFIHLHGEQPARLDRLARLEDKPTPELPAMAKFAIGLLFFNAHQRNISSLEMIYVDTIVYQWHWKKFLEERLEEWKAVMIMATVLWTADVGLLQVIINPSPSVTLIRGFVLSSIFCAMTSTVLSLLHDRQHRPRVNEDMWHAAQYLSRHWDAKRGFLSLAMLHSLPYVLLLWAFLLAAIATFIFGLTSGGHVVVYGVVALMVFAVCITISKWNVVVSNWTVNSLRRLLYVAQMLWDGRPGTIGYLTYLNHTASRWHRFPSGAWANVTGDNEG